MIASGAAGGYDAYARLLARHVGRHIPGEPAIVPKNVPAAGGLTAVNTLYSVAARDGLTLGAPTNGIAGPGLVPGIHVSTLWPRRGWAGRARP